MQETKEQKEGLKSILFFLFALILNLIIGIMVYHFTDISMNVSKGSDTMYHIYRGQWLLSEIEKGNIYPIYNPVWYNGVELMRYWTPMAAYLMAFCHFMAKNISNFPAFFPRYHGGYTFGGFSLFAGLIYFIGAMNWSIIGICKKRKFLGLIIGILYMFIPTGIYLYYGEGNLPRSLIIAILPLFMYSISGFISTEKRKYILYTALSFSLMVLCHVGYAGMVAISFLFFIIISIITEFFENNKEMLHHVKKIGTLFFAVIFGILITGIFLYPSLKGGLAQNSKNTSRVAILFFQPLLKTLNPIAKYKEGYAYYYYGISLFLIALFGVFGSRKKQRPIFITALLIVVLTAEIFGKSLTSMPGGQFLWMLRFLPIAASITFYSIMEWKTLKKPILYILIAFIFLDSIQMLKIYKNTGNFKKPEDPYIDVAKNSFLVEAKKLTNNRIALMDASSGTYYLTGMGKSTNQMLGQGWEASSTANQIVRVNEAYEFGNYMYMFDRMKELGVDVICFNKNLPIQSKYKTKKVLDAAFKNGYKRVRESKDFSLYKLKDVNSTFGVISKYEGIAIGKAAEYISTTFPNVETSDERYIDDFTLKDLLKYKTVYLTKFEYRDLKKAEQLIKNISDKGIKVYIMADGLPINPHTQTKKFLGVEAMNINFENAYPLIHTNRYGNFATKLFDEDMLNWSTVYLNGLDKIDASINVLEKKLGAMGTKYNDNIHFIALNLTYFYATTKDKNVGRLLSLYTNNSFDNLPKRKIVPTEVIYLPREIRIKTFHDNVNTTIATHDIFTGNYRVSGRLVYVNKGNTIIKMHYPYLKQGITMSILGIIFLITLIIAPWSRILSSEEEKLKLQEKEDNKVE